MLQPRLVPAFLVARRQAGIYMYRTYLTLHVLIGPFFQSPNYIT